MKANCGNGTLILKISITVFTMTIIAGLAYDWWAGDEKQQISLKSLFNYIFPKFHRIWCIKLWLRNLLNVLLEPPNFELGRFPKF